MKKIKLTESQVAKLLNESPYEKINTYRRTKLLSGKGTLGSSELDNICDVLYDAIDGLGTTLPDISGSFERCKNLHDVINVFSRFKKRKGEDLMEWLDGDINFDTEWDKYVLRPIANAASVSRQEGHFKEVVQDDTEKNIMAKFPCLGDTPGYTFSRAKKGILYFKVNSDDYAVKEDGTLMKHDGSQWNAFPEKTKCIGAKYQDVSEQDINEVGGIDLSPGVEKVEPEVKSTSTTNNTTTTGDTKTKSTVATAATAGAGGSISDFQQKLKDAGFGASLGNVDGRLGPKTARAAMEFIKSKGLLSETDDVSLNEQISRNFKRFL